MHFPNRFLAKAIKKEIKKEKNVLINDLKKGHRPLHRHLRFKKIGA
jgi:hypothetical protein